ncbi:hypothetical protein CEXT_252771 [Caerostris extrusa]|uniref:Uncharacterized protein n=1 Tax=Caerostris extrusa TaxID=172846 RepID=A0AAV4MY30_CAEEX|nr:hypothetical protein CEXT_252771 [Caerostris extrusa]
MQEIIPARKEAIFCHCNGPPGYVTFYLSALFIATSLHWSAVVRWPPQRPIKRASRRQICCHDEGNMQPGVEIKVAFRNDTATSPAKQSNFGDFAGEGKVYKCSAGSLISTDFFIFELLPQKKRKHFELSSTPNK